MKIVVICFSVLLLLGGAGTSGVSTQAPASTAQPSDPNHLSIQVIIDTLNAAAPTNATKAAPTNAPTAAPTNAPTAAPTDAPTAAPTEAPQSETSRGCVDPDDPTSCQGRANGDYPVCRDCEKGIYVTCSNGYHYVRPCALGFYDVLVRAV